MQREHRIRAQSPHRAREESDIFSNATKRVTGGLLDVKVGDLMVSV